MDIGVHRRRSRRLSWEPTDCGADFGDFHERLEDGIVSVSMSPLPTIGLVLGQGLSRLGFSGLGF